MADKYLIGAIIAWILAILLAAFVLPGMINPITTVNTYVASPNDPYIGLVNGTHVRWDEDVIRVAWKGQYNEEDVSINEEAFFELEQITHKKFIVVDPLVGQPQILIDFEHADSFGFPWGENWGGMTSVGWYPTGKIAGCAMVYISVDSCQDSITRENCIKHELGHAMGLGHIEGQNVMNPGICGQTEYTSEDITILHTIYDGST